VSPFSYPKISIDTLSIRHLILIEQTTLSLSPGLNIITGETGSGKSALLTALRLIAGERADAQWIQSGKELAVVEAHFTDGLVVRREIHRSGRSRAFLNDALSSVHELKEAVGERIALVDQSSAPQLASAPYQRRLLDRFAGLEKEARTLGAKWGEKRALEEKLAALQAQKPLAAAQASLWRNDLEAIEQLGWKEGEEERLSQEHDALSASISAASQLAALLEQLTQSVPLKKLAAHLEQLARRLPPLAPAAASLKTAALEAQEAESLLAQFLARLDADPARLDAIEERIGAIERIKKRIAPTFASLLEAKKGLLSRIAEAEGIDDQIAAVEQQLEPIAHEVAQLTDRLSEGRRRAQPRLEEACRSLLSRLHLPQARFTIRLTPQPPSPAGAESLTLLFSSHPSLPELPLEECASGGELSRLLLALETAAAGSSLLIFDEIDSNVGGQAASAIGAVLQELARSRQILCVTHFVQVAKCGDAHILVSKQEGLATAMPLIGNALSAEYERMTGSTKNSI
jgi:DNA repair protein RecN (Recombination protein N)